MDRFVLHEVRYVLMAMWYSTRCLSSKIQDSLVDASVFWCLTLIPIVVLCVPMFVCLILDSNDLMKFVTVLVPFTEILLTNVKMIICNVKRGKIIKLINQMQLEWDEYKKSDYAEIQKLIGSTTRKTRIFVIVYTASFFLIVVEYATLPLFKLLYHRVIMRDNSNYITQLPYDVRLFYSIEDNASFGVTYFFTLVAAFVLAFALTGFDSMFSTLSMHITTMFQFLKIEIDQLARDLEAGAPRKELHAKLRRIILKHKSNLSLIDQLEDNFSFFLMIQFLTSSIVVCVVLYKLTTVFGLNEDTIKTMTYLPGAILQLYLLCWYSQNIMDEAVQVAAHIYNVPWYLSEPTLQKTILTLMVKAQKPYGLTASKFYMVTLQSFQRIISTSYSYFTLLQTVNEK